MTKNGVTSVVTAADQITYTDLPVVTGVSPALGSTGGGGTVTVTGFNLAGAAVALGGVSVPSLDSNGPTLLTFHLPAGTLGTVDLTATTPAGTSATGAADQFTYTDQVVITGVSPAIIPTPGEMVTITGVNLQDATVLVNGSGAYAYASNGPTAVTFRAPAQGAGVYDITAQSATPPFLVSATGSADQITYSDATVTSVSPQYYPLTGGEPMTVAGSFGSNPRVYVGTTLVTSFTSNTPHLISFPAPAVSAGVYDVTVKTVNNTVTSATSAADRVTYTALPIVTGVSPPTSPLAGGVPIALSGYQLNPSNAAHGRVGSTTISQFSSNSPTLLTFAAPAEALGVYDVFVTKLGASLPFRSADQLTYSNAPTVTGVSPAIGRSTGGDQVTISGFNLLNATVQIGGVATDIVACTSTSITLTTRASSDGAADVIVTTPYGPSAQSAADTFTYTSAPIITGVAPAIGMTAGGDTVTVTGLNLDSPTLYLDGNDITGSIVAATTNSITFTTPAYFDGTYDIIVVTGFGQSDLTAADQFTYTSDPVITEVSPREGSDVGGDTVTLTGLNLGDVTDVFVGGSSATLLSTGANSVSFLTPAGAGAGPAGVTIATTSSGANSPIDFLYVDPPAVTGVSPLGGLPVGGVPVTISGGGFTQVTSVQFGAQTITAFTSVSDTAITFPAPASPGLASGPVDVTVTTPGGTSAVSASDVYTYAPAPTLTGVSPGTTRSTGGDVLTITGTDFTNVTSVQFGTTGETNFSGNTPMHLTIPVPALAAGVRDVTVTTPSGTTATSLSDRLTVVDPPVLSPATLTAATVGVAYSQTLSVAGGTAPFTYAKTSGSLPAGLSLSSNGHLTGTPTAGGTFNFQITATDSSASSGPYTATVAYTLTVNAATIVVSPSTLPSGTVAAAYTQTVSASGGTAPYGLAVTSGSLPAGLSLLNGVLSGTPTAGGTFNFTLTATDSSTGTGPYSGGRAYSLVMAAPTLTVSPTTVPATTISVAYSQTLTASGGTAPRTLAVTSGALPTGVTLSSAGALSGTPSVSGTFNFTATATDSSTGTGPYTGGRAYALTVNSALSIAPAALAGATAGTATVQTITVTHGTGPYASLTVTGFSAGATGLTAGMLTATASAGTVVLSGTPTAAGSATFTVNVTDAVGATATKNYTVVVNPALSVAPAALLAATSGAVTTQTMAVSGGTTPYTAFTVTSFVAGGTGLTVGMFTPNLGAGTLVLSGTPTAAGSATFTVNATDTAGATVSKNYTVGVNTAMSLAPSALVAATAGTATNQTLTLGNGTTPYTALTVTSFAAGTTGLTAGALTPTLGTGAVVLSGTPSGAGSATFTVNATDTAGATLTSNYTLVVNPALSIAPASLAGATAGTATAQTMTVGNGTAPYVSLVVSGFSAGTTGLTAGMLTATAGTGTVVLSGTPTAAGSASFTVTVVDTAGASAAKNYTLTVNPVMSIAPSTLAPATAGTVTNQTMTLSNGSAPYTALTVTGFSAGTTGLTAGMLTATAGTGTVVLNGTPTAAGTATFTVNATDSAGATLTKNYTLTVNAGMSIAPATLAPATAGAVTNQTMTVSNGTAPYTALTVTALSAGTTGLTAGMFTATPSAGTVVLNGTPTVAGTATFTVNATDTAGATLTKNYTLVVNPAISIAPATLAPATAGAVTSQTMTLSHGTAPYTALAVTALSAGTTGLTAGMFTATPSAGTVVLNGTPTAAGTATFTVNATDTAGATLTKNYTLTVNAVPSFSPASLAAATAGAATNQTITVTSGTAPYTALTVTNFVAGATGLTSGMLTATAGAGTVVLSGTPAGAGTATFTVNVTDTAGAIATKNYTLTVNAAMSIAPASLAPATSGAVTNQTITVSSGTTPYTALTVTNFVAGGTGLTSAALTPNLGAGTFVLNGTPTTAGTATFTVNATDTAGATATKNYTLTVNILTIAPASLAPATAGAATAQTITVGGGTAPYTALTVTNFVAGATGLTSAALTPNLGTGTVVLSGTPTGAGSATFNINVTDTAGGTLTKAYTLTVNAALAIGPASLAPATALGATTQTITVSNGTTPYTTLTVTGFDGGLTGLTSAALTATPALGTVVLSGTPSAGGSATFTINATDTAGGTATKTYTLTVNPPLSIGPCTLATAVVTNATHQTITVAGGTTPYTSLTISSFVGGSTGLTGAALAATAGAGTVVLSGTPGGTGSATFTVNVTDTAGATTSKNYTLTVVAKATATLTLGNLSGTYDGTPKLASVTTAPPGLAVLYTYDGTPLAITPPGGSIAVYSGAIGQTLYLQVTGATTGTVYGGNGTASGNYGINSDVPTAAVHAGVLTSGQSAVIQVNVLPDQAPYAGSLANAVTSQSEGTAGGAFQIVGVVTTGFTLGPVTAGTYAVVATIWDSGFQGTASGSLVIGLATPTVTWATPNPIVYGTPLSATQLNPTASVPGTFAFNYGPPTVLFAGSPTLTTTFTPTDAVDYTTATGSVTLTVTQAAPVVAWATPAAVAYGMTLSGAQLNATSSVPGTFAYTPAAGTTPPVGNQTLSVLFTPTDSTNYSTVTTTTTLAVGPGVPVIAWAPAPITYGTLLSATQLNASATLGGSAVAGTFTYTPAVGTLLTVGSQTLAFTFVPTDTVHYSTVVGSTLLMVNQATPTIGWATPTAITFGTALSATQLNAAATNPANGAAVPGKFVYTPDVGFLPPAGSQSLSVAFTPTDTANYKSNTQTNSLTVNQAPAVMRWAVPAAISYGTTLSATQLSATVTVNGAAAVGTLMFTPGTGAMLNAGLGQTLKATFTPMDAVDITGVTGTVSLDVLPASQTITFPAISGAQIGVPLVLSATASSGQSVTFGLVSGNAALNGATLSLNDGNTVVVSASVAASANYQSAKTSLAITAGSKKGQSITFSGIDQHLTTDRPFTLSAAADSGLAVTYSLVSGPAIVSGSTVVLTGGAGTVTVQASQPGDAVYQPAAPVSVSFAVVAPPIAVSFFGSTAGTSGSSSGDPVRVVLNGITLHAVATSSNIAATLAANGKSGVLIGFLPSLNQGFVLNLAPDNSGHYSGTTATVGGAGTPVTLTITGTATLAGVSGTIQPLGLSFGAVADPTSGPTAAISGIYQSTNLNGAAGVTYSLVGTQGQVFVLAVTPTAVASGTGTVNANTGAFIVQTAQSTSVAGAINAAANTVTGTVTTATGSTLSFSGASSAVVSTNVLVNMSSRGTVSPGLPLIVGFVVNGTVPKTVGLRGVGPGLLAFGLTNVLTIPQLTLYDASAQVLATNTTWGGTAALSSAFLQVGAFGLPGGSLDTALKTTLAPGLYTMVISDGANDAGGTALAEIYDASVDPSETTQKLANVSSRGQVTSASPLIAGFVVSGNSPKKVLVRAVGPGLSAFSVANVLLDPVLTVNDVTSAAIAQNNDWGTPQALTSGQTLASAADITAAGSAAGAFPLVVGSKDAAMVVTLAPGNYTAVVTGAGGSSGAALVEVYELASP